MKIACLVTGAPRTYAKCIESLKRYLRNHEVDFYCVFRDDNTDAQTTKEIISQYNPVEFKITTASDTYEIENSIKFHWPFIRMWHEVFEGMKLIKPHKDKYDCFIRVRFDTFFADEVVVENIIQNTCILPKNYTFLGANDMLCIADWQAFQAYASTYNNLDTLRKKLIHFTPEVIVLTNLNLQGVKYIEQDIAMSLRRPIYDHLNDQEYSALTYKEPGRLLIKYENFEKNLEKYESEIRNMTDIARKESCFPTNSQHNNHFYTAEFDQDHQRYFRFFASQAWIYRYIDKDKKYFRIILRHKVRHAPLDLFAVFMEGEAPDLAFTEHPDGGWVVTGEIPASARGKAPNVKIGFMLNYTVVPSETDENSSDHRLLSAAIMEPEFLSSLNEAPPTEKVS
ncbi:hypothetical protein [Brevundimonas sp.]|uniref:hypothetical protein n=1 Tax=Brevundimonas sp. TaxID=1871086 RepID=UPI0028991142|nr:hypothetical protein [Brevundimonas sp.]